MVKEVRWLRLSLGQKILVGFLTCFLIAVGIAFAVNNYVLQEHKGNVVGIAFDVSPAIVDWGNILADTSKNYTFTVTNTGTINITLYHTESLPDGFSLDWNYTGSVISPGKIEWINWTLTVGSTFGSFDFNVTINATPY